MRGADDDDVSAARAEVDHERILALFRGTVEQADRGPQPRLLVAARALPPARVRQHLRQRLNGGERSQPNLVNARRRPALARKALDEELKVGTYGLVCAAVAGTGRLRRLTQLEFADHDAVAGTDELRVPGRHERCLEALVDVGINTQIPHARIGREEVGVRCSENRFALRGRVRAQTDPVSQMALEAT